MEAQKKHRHEAKFLELGFSIKWLSDKSGYYYQKNILNEMFINLHIIIDNKIYVWCEEANNSSFKDMKHPEEYNIVCEKYTFPNLLKILKYFEK